MTTFVCEEAREYVDIGYEEIFDPTTQSTHRQYQVREKSGRILDSEFDSTLFKRRLTTVLGRMRITLHPTAVGKSIRGWMIQAVRTVDGTGKEVDIYYQVVDPQRVIRAGNFSTIKEAEHARGQLMVPSNFNDQNQGSGSAPSM